MVRKILMAAALCVLAPAAFAQDTCNIELEGNDAMKFNLTNIDVPSSCTNFTINLKHTGRMAKNVMGHNVVITKTSDIAPVAADGLKAGLAVSYIKVDDARVIAHSDTIGGGETTSVTFDVSKIATGGPFSFFCSFPGHSGLMKGTIAVK